MLNAGEEQTIARLCILALDRYAGHLDSFDKDVEALLTSDGLVVYKAYGVDPVVLGEDTIRKQIIPEWVRQIKEGHPLITAGLQLRSEFGKLMSDEQQKAVTDVMGGKIENWLAREKGIKSSEPQTKRSNLDYHYVEGIGDIAPTLNDASRTRLLNSLKQCLELKSKGKWGDAFRVASLKSLAALR